MLQRPPTDSPDICFTTLTAMVNANAPSVHSRNSIQLWVNALPEEFLSERANLQRKAATDLRDLSTSKRRRSPLVLISGNAMESQTPIPAAKKSPKQTETSSGKRRKRHVSTSPEDEHKRLPKLRAPISSNARDSVEPPKLPLNARQPPPTSPLRPTSSILQRHREDTDLDLETTPRAGSVSERWAEYSDIASTTSSERSNTPSKASSQRKRAPSPSKMAALQSIGVQLRPLPHPDTVTHGHILAPLWQLLQKVDDYAHHIGFPPRNLRVCRPVSQ